MSANVMNVTFSIKKTSLLLFVFSCFFISCSQDKADASTFFLKGNVQLKGRNYLEAIRFYDDAILKNPDFSDAYLNKAIALLQLNRVQKSFDVLTAILSKQDSYYPAALLRAEVALRLGDLESAQKDLKLIEKSYKDSSEFYMVRGNLFNAKNDLSSSFADFDRSVLLNPSNVMALVNRGALLYQKQEFDQAETDFKKAIELDPLQAEALNNMGLIRIRQDNLREARGYFDKATQIAPANPFFINNKGYGLLLSNKPDDALPYLEKALKMQPENGYALRNMGLFYLRTNSPEKALDYFRHAIDLAEPVDDLYGYAGEAYLQLDKKEDACSLWKKGIILEDQLAKKQSELHCR